MSSYVAIFAGAVIRFCMVQGLTDMYISPLVLLQAYSCALISFRYNPIYSAYLQKQWTLDQHDGALLSYGCRCRSKLLLTGRAPHHSFSCNNKKACQRLKLELTNLDC